jgi:hypothetical protein
LATDEPISVAQDIKPLFRERDRRSMRFAFETSKLPSFKGWVKAGTPA